MIRSILSLCPLDINIILVEGRQLLSESIDGNENIIPKKRRRIRVNRNMSRSTMSGAVF